MNRIVYKRILAILLMLDIVAIVALACNYISDNIPNEIVVMLGKDDDINFGMGCNLTFSDDSIGAISVDNKKLDESNLDIDVDKTVNIKADKKGNYSAKVNLLGIFNVKQISVKVIDNIKVKPVGIPTGIYIDTDGVLVLGTGDINNGSDTISSPAKNIIKSGDYIIKIDDNTVKYKSQIIEQLQKNNSDKAKVTLRRNNEVINVAVGKSRDSEGKYKIGVWVRDNMQGIGMITYVTKDLKFAALGHGVSDIDTGGLMNIDNGMIYGADIIKINKSYKGKPGELVGIIHSEKDVLYGKIDENLEQGIYGCMTKIGVKKIDEILDENSCNNELQLGLKQEIKVGKAVLQTRIYDHIENYDIEIEKIYKNGEGNGKDFVVAITDKRLLSECNGIVQGMSGSPIIQNGKLVGALTHVMVNNPEKGYGIFIEEMLENN